MCTHPYIYLELDQVGQGRERGWQPDELVVGRPQLAELDEVVDAARELAESIGRHVERCEVDAVLEGVGDVGQLGTRQGRMRRAGRHGRHMHAGAARDVYACKYLVARQAENHEGGARANGLREAADLVLGVGFESRV